MLRFDIRQSPTWYTRYKTLKATLRQERVVNYIKAILSCIICCIIMLISRVRHAIGPSYFLAVVVAVNTHSGRTVGSNIELQLQNLIICACTTSLILCANGVIYGISKISSIDLGTAAKITYAFALALYSFFASSVYAYAPRFGFAIKTNMIAPITAFTIYPITSQFDPLPLPGIIYAELIGIGVTTFVNVAVAPSTSSRKLTASFRKAVSEMVECCEFFTNEIDNLGSHHVDLPRSAASLRVSVHAAVSAFGEVVRGTKYEVSISRFSHSDYRKLFGEINKLANSFGGMCLPFEIDRRVMVRINEDREEIMAEKKHNIDKTKRGLSLEADRLERHDRKEVARKRPAEKRKVRSASISSANSDIEFCGSCTNKHTYNDTNIENSDFPGSGSCKKTVDDFNGPQKLVPVFRSMTKFDAYRAPRPSVPDSEQWQLYVQRSTSESIRSVKLLLALHQRALKITLRNFEGLNFETPTKGLIALLKHAVRSPLSRVLGKPYPASDPQMMRTYEELGDIEERCENPHSNTSSASNKRDFNLEQLDSIANALEAHSKLFEKIESKNITEMARHQWRLDQNTQRRYTMLLSFVGVVRENSSVLVVFLRLCSKLLARRSPRDFSVWFPPITWAWILQKDISEDEQESKDPEGAGLAFEDTIDDRKHSKPKFYEPSESPELHDRLSMASVHSSPTKRRCLGVRIACKFLKRKFKIVVDYVVNLLICIDGWIRKPQTQYSIIFTIVMMTWGIWAFIDFSRDFFIDNRCHWGLIAIGFIFTLAMGNTLNAGVRRFIASIGAGVWGIISWEASRYGSNPYLAWMCMFIYYATVFYILFFVPKWSGIATVLNISYTSTFFPAYYLGKKGEGTKSGWERIVVNAISILYVIIIMLFARPYTARSALRSMLAEVLRLGSLVAEAVNFTHTSRSFNMDVFEAERQRLSEYVNKSRHKIAKCRALYDIALSEPSFQGPFRATAHKQLIDTLELQLEWLIYAHSTSSTPQTHDMVRCALRETFPDREGIIGSEMALSYILAASLELNERLPAYLPDISTAKVMFSRHASTMILNSYMGGMYTTEVCRWQIGIWNIVTVQEDLRRCVYRIVGSHADSDPEGIEQMIRWMRMGEGVGPLVLKGPLIKRSLTELPGPAVQLMEGVCINRPNESQIKWDEGEARCLEALLEVDKEYKQRSGVRQVRKNQWFRRFHRKDKIE